MNYYCDEEKTTYKDYLKNNSYPGRGIIMGLTPDGRKAVCAYFIMGRSANSRNRFFEYKEGVLYTKPFDESKVEDPTLIIYAAKRTFCDKIIITNGDHTDTLYKAFADTYKAVCEETDEKKRATLPVNDGVFEKALFTRTFEPDAPNFTPRISGLMERGLFTDHAHSKDGVQGEGLRYKLSILKTRDGVNTGRYFYSYEAACGVGHMIHTYECDGNPLMSFQGEPRQIETENDMDSFANELWKTLDENNKIALFVSYTDVKTGQESVKIINKNEQ